MACLITEQEGFQVYSLYKSGPIASPVGIHGPGMDGVIDLRLRVEREGVIIANCTIHLIIVIGGWGSGSLN